MSQIITADRRMLELIQLAKTVAQSKATVLIQGESGTGKELMANLIHNNSNRANKPFVAINCAAIPENLLESELFGYEKGAFTGAMQTKPGKFELANGGTLLLDEISEIDIRLQAKLLRVIQEGQVDRVGSRRPISVDVRIIATTNKKLSDCVRSGAFREDLFYRLNVVNLTIPGLKDRIEDVELLAGNFVRVYGERNGKPARYLSREAISLLGAHQWPGNVRELENVIERAVITCDRETIDAKDIYIERETARENMPAPALIVQGMKGGVTMPGSDSNNWIPGTTLDDIERKVILDALSYHNGNRTHTAKALGISIRTLRNKLSDYRKMGIQV